MPPFIYFVAILIGILIISGIVKVFFRRPPFFIILFSAVSITAIFFTIKLYSPTLTIVVPKGYKGQIALVLSNVNNDILRVDSNGIGYITKLTFDRVYTKPIVLETDGVDISGQAVGFNPSTFWARGNSSMVSTSNNRETQEIQFKSFEIVPVNKMGEKQYYNIDLTEFVDKSKLYRKKEN